MVNIYTQCGMTFSAPRVFDPLFKEGKPLTKAHRKPLSHLMALRFHFACGFAKQIKENYKRACFGKMILWAFCCLKKLSFIWCISNYGLQQRNVWTVSPNGKRQIYKCAQRIWLFPFTFLLWFFIWFKCERVGVMSWRT